MERGNEATSSETAMATTDATGVATGIGGGTGIGTVDEEQGGGTAVGAVLCPHCEMGSIPPGGSCDVCAKTIAGRDMGIVEDDPELGPTKDPLASYPEDDPDDPLARDPDDPWG